jgi:hypothetical protein
MGAPVAAWVVRVVVLASRDARPLAPSVDADQDGWVDTVETGLGSSASNPAQTPEHIAAQPTCLDGFDNDGDGQPELADGGYTTAVPVGNRFPDAAGVDIFDSHIVLDDYALVTGAFGTCRIDFDAHGPTIVQRGAPVDLGGGLREMPIEIVAMQLGGSASVLGGAGCTIPPGTYPVTVLEDPVQTSTGTVTDTSTDASTDFPADSFFDVFFLIDTPLGVLPGGPPNGPIGQPVRVSNTGITGLPPFHGPRNPNCYRVQGLAHEHCPKAPPDHFKCYKAKFPKFARRQVSLRDQFGQEQATVVKPRFFCTATAKNAEPLYQETDHLECYALKPVKAAQTVTVRNQFGTGPVETVKSGLLCLPTNKNDEGDPQELDHFKASAMLCTPSSKNAGASTTTTTASPATTTTTLPGGITLMGSYIHPNPGTPPSFVCGKVTAPAGNSAAIRVTGPNAYDMSTTAPLDSGGVGRFQVAIFEFGAYTITATVGTQSAMATVNVTAAPGQCP